MPLISRLLAGENYSHRQQILSGGEFSKFCLRENNFLNNENWEVSKLSVGVPLFYLFIVKRNGRYFTKGNVPTSCIPFQGNSIKNQC